MATQAELEADIAAVRAARLAFVTTGTIKEIARDGRRIVHNRPSSLADFDDVLASLQGELDAIVAEAAGSRRFRALRPRFNRGW